MRVNTASAETRSTSSRSPPLLPALTTQPGAGGATDYTFTFTKPVTRPGATYVVEITTDFISWQAVADSLVSSTPDTETRRAPCGFHAAGPSFRVALSRKALANELHAYGHKLAQWNIGAAHRAPPI